MKEKSRPFNTRCPRKHDLKGETIQSLALYSSLKCTFTPIKPNVFVYDDKCRP